MSGFERFRRSQVAELCAWTPDFDMTRVSVSDADKGAGSPKPGDMIARNPKNHDDKWLVAAKYFADNFEADRDIDPAIDGDIAAARASERAKVAEEIAAAIEATIMPREEADDAETIRHCAAIARKHAKRGGS